MTNFAETDYRFFSNNDLCHEDKTLAQFPAGPLIQPWVTLGRAVAIDSTGLRARGDVWHQKHREKGELPRSTT
jgi:hypothetical protein